MNRHHDTPRTDAVLNTFDGKASTLAAALATHAEDLEREVVDGSQRVQEAREYFELCKKSYGTRPTEYESGVLLGLEIAINFAGPSSANAPVVAAADSGLKTN